MQYADNEITFKEAKKVLENGITLTNSAVTGVLEITAGSEWNKEITIENCIIENFSCIMVQFYKSIIIRNCHLKNASFNFSYFLGGLTIENCVFDEYLDFEAGGHNSLGNTILIKENRFRGFVNFFDCWFTGEISIYNNTFENGTNILSKEQLVSFDIPVLIENNVGDLGIESESRETNSNFQ